MDIGIYRKGNKEYNKMKSKTYKIEDSNCNTYKTTITPIESSEEGLIMIQGLKWIPTNAGYHVNRDHVVSIFELDPDEDDSKDAQD